MEINYDAKDIISAYKNLIERNENKKNEYASNIQKIAVHDTYSVADKVKEIYKGLYYNKKVVFGKMFSLKEKPKAEIVTAFNGVLELSRRSKIETKQKEIFGDIEITKRRIKV